MMEKLSARRRQTEEKESEEIRAAQLVLISESRQKKLKESEEKERSHQSSEVRAERVVCLNYLCMIISKGLHHYYLGLSLSWYMHEINLYIVQCATSTEFKPTLYIITHLSVLFKLFP